jgi:hypothetical protein
MENNRIEKMVYNYLDSIVGGNPVLKKEKVIDRYWSNRIPVENFYVNGVKVGVRKYRDNGVFMERGIRLSIMDLFDLDTMGSYFYFRSWINKLERDDR